MNKLILLIAILFSSATFAASGFPVCEKIAAINSSNTRICNTAVRGYDFDINFLQVCSDIANSSTSNSVECLKNSADKFYDQSAVEVCKKIAGINSRNGALCALATGNKNYDPSEIRVCSKLASSSTNRAIECLQDGGYDASQAPAPNSCELAESKLIRIERLANSVLVDLGNLEVRRATRKLLRILDLAAFY